MRGMKPLRLAMKAAPQVQLHQIMLLLTELGIAPDPDPVNRVKRLTGQYVALVHGVEQLAKAAKCLKKTLKPEK